jgi:hypothetical protein
MLELPFRRQFLQLPAPVLKSLPDGFFKKTVGRESGGNFKGGQRLGRLDLQIASFGYENRVPDRLRIVAPKSGHFLRGFEIEMVSLVAHAVGLAHNFASPDAKQDIVRHAVFALEIMTIVGTHQRNAGLLCDFNERGIYAMLSGKIVIHQLQIKIFRAEYIAQFRGFGQRFIGLLHKQPLRHGSLEAGGQCDEAAAMPRKELLVNPGPVIKSFEITVGNKPAEIVISLEILGQENQMVRLIASTGLLVTAFLGNVNLASEDGFQSSLAGGVVKLYGTE